MKAAVFHKIGAPLTIESVPDPTPRSGEVVIRVSHCGICGSDLHAATLPPGLPSKTVMGHEFAGEIVEVGSDAKAQWKIGDKVCALPAIGCGKCEACVVGDVTRCVRMRSIGLGQVPGAYAEFVLAGAQETLRLPENVGPHEGALVEPLSVGLHAVKQAQVKAGDNALVIGAGPIGLTVALWSKFFGARHVAVSEPVAARRSLASRYGATAEIDPSKESPAYAFQRLAGAAPDVVFECVGVPGMIQQCISMVRPRGRVCVVGVCVQPDTIFPVLAIVKEVRLEFVVGYVRGDFQFTLDMLGTSRIEAAAMITNQVNLEEFPAAFEALKKPQHECKVMLRI